MSITYTPHAGTVTTYGYRAVEIDSIEAGDDIVNDVVRTEYTEPEVQCHNGGGAWLAGTLGFAEYDDEGFVECCGTVAADRIDALLKRCGTARRQFVTEYESHKLDQFERLLLHCKYHGCGFSYG